MWPVLNKTLVKSFYFQHGGFFLFLFIVFFGIIAPSKQWEYHYALIRAILKAPDFLALVVFVWLLYAGKVVQFVLRVLDSPEGLFLFQLRCLSPIQCYWLLLRAQSRLFLPVSVYVLLIAGVGIRCGAWMETIAVILYVAGTCGVSAMLYYRRLGNPRIGRGGSRCRLTWGRRYIPYWSI